MTYPVIEASAVQQVTSVVLSLTPGQANDLYNEVYVVLRNRGIITVSERTRLAVPALYAVYDALAAAGIDGTGPTANPLRNDEP